VKKFIKAFLFGVGIGVIGSLLTPTTFGIAAVALLSLAAGRYFVLWGIADPMAAEPQLYLAALFAGEGGVLLLFNLLTKISGG
jgi:hypothetical protein